jgi:hypothetical protein
MPRGKKKIQLPTVLTEDTWFYKKYEDQLKPHLGKCYLSYSSYNAYEEYTEDFIKDKFVKLPQKQKLYASLGNYLGSAVEVGTFPEENPHGFTGQENLKLVPRPKGAEYERFVLIDMGEYIFIGFIDIYEEKKNKVKLGDLKTGGKNKEKYYASNKYKQILLYGRAVELEKKEIEEAYVWFVRRTGSHINPPLHISDEQFKIPLEYTSELGKKAVEGLDKGARAISDCYTTYLKFFGDEVK